MKKKKIKHKKRPKHVAETSLTITVGFHFTSEAKPSKIVKKLCQKARGGKKKLANYRRRSNFVDDAPS